MEKPTSGKFKHYRVEPVLKLMKSAIEKRVSEILSCEKQGGLPRAKLDVLRALVLYNGSIWRSELLVELGFLSSYQPGAGGLATEGLDRILKELEKEGLVKKESAVKATLQFKEGVKDELISLVDLRATCAALSRDKLLAAYRRR